MRLNRKGKPTLFSWRGVMGESQLHVRIVTAVVLLVACTALIFTQLGFVGIGTPGNYLGYAVVALQPVALGALLFGILPGAGIGLFAGVLMLLHAVLLPLDYYELAFVTPLTSILMMTVAGFLLGLLFALALRGNPKKVRRVIYIIIVSYIVAVLYSVGFWVNVFLSLLANLASEYGAATSSEIERAAFSDIASLTTRMGSLGVQVWMNAALIAIACIVGDFASRRVRSLEGTVGLRTLFGTRLSVVVLIAFMVTAAASYVGISGNEMRKYEALAKSELNYLRAQIGAADKRSEALEGFAQSYGIDLHELTDEQLTDMLDAVSLSDLLEGYDLDDDGTVFIFYNDALSLTNDERYNIGDTMETLLDRRVVQAIEAAKDTGQMQRIIYDDPEARAEWQDQSGATIQSQLAYLCVTQTDPDKWDGKYTLVMIKPASLVFADRPLIMALSNLLSLVLLLAVYLITARLLHTVVTKRIDQTNDVLAQVTAGDLDARVEIHDTREFESLSGGINSTVSTLKGWIAEAETRMDAELATAKAIQESALPRVFPPFPDNMRFDIYASMRAAREVGGDFYDFFLVGDNCTPETGKLAFLVADVSGKGVPAALFMMNAKALLRGYIESGLELGEAVENANHQLCETNDAGMFVTAWVGLLDYDTYHVDYVNAGHNPPLLWQKGSWEWLTQKSGLPLGLYNDLPYQAHSIECNTGDQFFVYSDGVTEAMSATDELYGEQRLEDLAKASYSLHPRELIEAVRNDVAQHALGAEQSDDITMLAIEVGVPPEITATLVLPAEDKNLPRVVEFIHTELDRRLCPLRVQHQLDIAVEELFVNVAHYAYPDATPENPGEVRISYTYSAEPPSITVDIIDDGIPYNPLEKPDAVTPDDINEVPIGGLGILMAKRSVDNMTYKYEDGSNIVSITKKW